MALPPAIKARPVHRPDCRPMGARPDRAAAALRRRRFDWLPQHQFQPIDHRRPALTEQHAHGNLIAGRHRRYRGQGDTCRHLERQHPAQQRVAMGWTAERGFHRDPNWGQAGCRPRSLEPHRRRCMDELLQRPVGAERHDRLGDARKR